MAAYGWQAIAALALILIVNRVLSNEEYALYSLAMAGSQAMAIVAFEWVRLAVSRFYPAHCSDSQNVLNDETARRVSSLWACAAAATALLLPIAALIGWAAGTLSVALTGAVVAVFQGVSDLQLTMLRFRGALGTFSLLQSMRAAVLLIGAVTGALAGGSAIASLTGLICAYLMAIGVAGAVDPYSRHFSIQEVSGDLVRRFAYYGFGAGGSAAIHFSVPLMIRAFAARMIGLESFAGMALAMDVMQRPFMLIITAVHGVIYPDVVRAFEQQKADIASRLNQLYRIHTWIILVGIGCALVMVNEAGQLLAKEIARPVFLSTAPWAAVFFGLHSFLQNVLAVPYQLSHRIGRLIGNAAFEVFAVAVAISALFAMGPLDPALVLAASAVGVALALAQALRGSRLRGSGFPYQLITTGAALMVLPTMLGQVRLQNVLVSIVIKASISVVFVFAGWLFLRWRNRIRIPIKLNGTE